MNYIIALCLAFLLVIFITISVKLFVLNRTERLKYIKNFKKGPFALVYLAAIPLFWIGIAYTGRPVGGALLLAIKACVELVVLKFDYDSVALMMSENMFYRVTMSLCFLFATINALLFTLTLVGKSVSNLCRKKFVLLTSDKIYVVVGYNEQNATIIKSVAKKDGKVILFTTTPNEEVTDFAFINKISYVKVVKGDVATTIARLFKKFDTKTVNVIINTDDEERNVVYTKQISTVISNLDLGKYSLDDTKGLNVYVIGKREDAAVYAGFVKASNGCVHYLNKYKLIARDFVDKYPITEFMTEREIDYSTASIKKDVSLNVVLIGFGKINQQVFLASLANNQLISKVDGKVVEKPINYWIYDKKDVRNDKNLNHNYFRFVNELLPDHSEYLPLPPEPANVAFDVLDINDIGFYSSVRQKLLPKNDEHVYNYVIISLDSDIENLEFSHIMVEKLREWNVVLTTKVFTKVKDSVLYDSVTADDGFIPYGNEDGDVYSMEQIVAEKKELMARDKHLCYALSNNDSNDDEFTITQNALLKWFNMSQVQRDSNTYACLSIRLKLHLLGFDYYPIEHTAPSANQEYQAAYEKGDKIIYLKDKKRIKGRALIDYSPKFVEGSIRQSYSILEHQRWNAYMISCGYIPSTIKQIKAGSAKSAQERRDGGITTYEGLLEYNRLRAEISNETLVQNDVIKYDYQLMDDLVWLLTENGYKIVHKGQR